MEDETYPRSIALEQVVHRSEFSLLILDDTMASHMGLHLCCSTDPNRFSWRDTPYRKAAASSMKRRYSCCVGDNIRYGRPQAGEDDILRAARRIAKGDWLRNLPQGLDTDVGERGSKVELKRVGETVTIRVV